MNANVLLKRVSGPRVVSYRWNSPKPLIRNRDGTVISLEAYLTSRIVGPGITPTSPTPTHCVLVISLAFNRLVSLMYVKRKSWNRTP